MATNLSEHDAMLSHIAGALRSTIDAHGPITKELLGSAAKRVLNQLRASLASGSSAPQEEIARLTKERDEYKAVASVGPWVLEAVRRMQTELHGIRGAAEPGSVIWQMADVALNGRKPLTGEASPAPLAPVAPRPCLDCGGDRQQTVILGDGTVVCDDCFYRRRDAVTEASPAPSEQPQKSEIEVRYATLDTGEQEFDEIVADRCSVHLEKMNDGQFYLGIETATEYAKFWISATGDNIGAMEYERGPQREATGEVSPAVGQEKRPPYETSDAQWLRVLANDLDHGRGLLVKPGIVTAAGPIPMVELYAWTPRRFREIAKILERAPAPQEDQIRQAAQHIYDKFSQDERDGYRSRDRQFAIAILGRVLALPVEPKGGPAQMTRDEHLMTIAIEECSEVAQRISKALRFGMEQIQQDADDRPEQNPERLTNRERIRVEYIDLVAAMEMLGIEVPVSAEDEARIHAKREKVERYLKRSEACGTLQGALPVEAAAPPPETTKGDR